MTRFMSRLCKLFTGLMSSLGVMFIVRHIIQALVNQVCYDVARVDVDSVISNYLKIKIQHSKLGPLRFFVQC